MSYSQLAMAQCMIGINIIIAKSLTTQVPLFLLLTLRFVIGSLILFVLAKLYHLNIFSYLQTNKMRLKDWLIILAQAVCAGFLFNFFMLSGLKYSSAAIAGIITSILPATIAFLSFILLREKLTSQRAISILLAVISLVALNLGKNNNNGLAHSNLIGDTLLLIAVFPEALFTVFAKYSKLNLNPIIMALIVNFVNAVLFLPLGIMTSMKISVNFNLTNMALIFLYGLFGGALSFIFWFQGLKNCPASVAALFTTLVPVSTIILAYFMLNEAINNHEIIAGMFVILSIVLGALNFKLKTSLSDQVVAN